MTISPADETIVWALEGSGSLFIAPRPSGFKALRKNLAKKLLETEPFNPGKWQQLDTSGSDAHRTHELLNVSVWYPMPNSQDDLVEFVDPDMPWAEGHFLERVAGRAVNPGDWHDKWPYHAGRVNLHQNGGKYDHNYMERFWPTDLTFDGAVIGKGISGEPFTGYRFDVGDLNDVIDQLRKDRGTRQAYLPIFFPEDTGAKAGQRVPCTLGYHFIIRDGQLHMTYLMRSCEIYRHFTNDVYMAIRLAEYVAAWVDMANLKLGQLTMQITSLHGFVGDTDKIEEFANGN